MTQDVSCVVARAAPRALAESELKLSQALRKKRRAAGISHRTAPHAHTPRSGPLLQSRINDDKNSQQCNRWSRSGAAWSEPTQRNATQRPLLWLRIRRRSSKEEAADDWPPRGSNRWHQNRALPSYISDSISYTEPVQLLCVIFSTIQDSRIESWLPSLVFVASFVAVAVALAVVCQQMRPATKVWWSAEGRV